MTLASRPTSGFSRLAQLETWLLVLAVLDMTLKPGA
jgi:hypothetical protein